jgi:hypothetical protein
VCQVQYSLLRLGEEAEEEEEEEEEDGEERACRMQRGREGEEEGASHHAVGSTAVHHAT